MGGTYFPRFKDGTNESRQMTRLVETSLDAGDFEAVDDVCVWPEVS